MPRIHRGRCIHAAIVSLNATFYLRVKENDRTTSDSKKDPIPNFTKDIEYKYVHGT